MMELITEKELVHLMTYSPFGTPVQLTWGVNKVWLQDVPENDWARAELIAIRSAQ
jgi:hypothetical protein